jgi:hypothetical protein
MKFRCDTLVRYAARALSIEECGGESQTSAAFSKISNRRGDLGKHRQSDYAIVHSLR